MPEITETLYVVGAEQWRAWLEENYQIKDDIWLVYPHKSSGRERIIYNDAVEQALCFGWIDSTVKSFGPDSSVQRFTPRRSNSPYSQQNKERIKWLAAHKLLKPEVENLVGPILKEIFEFPVDIVDAIKKNPQAWLNYQKFSDSYKRIRVAYIDEQRRDPELFERSLNNFIQKTAKNKQFGHGGIDKYF